MKSGIHWHVFFNRLYGLMNQCFTDELKKPLKEAWLIVFFLIITGNGACPSAGLFRGGGTPAIKGENCPEK